jgi:hypothetical protein
MSTPAKTPRVTFRRGRESRPKTVIVSRSGSEVGKIQEIRETGLWFWYSRAGGVYVNTCQTPATLDACKAAIIAHFQSLPVT